MINKQLNLVIPVDIKDTSGWVHSTPISNEVFEKYFEPMSIALERLGGNLVNAPKIAAFMLKKVAKSLDEWNGSDGVENGLMNEIRRLTNVIMPSDAGWQTIPYYTAIQRGMLEQADIQEIDGAIVFFTLAYAVYGAKRMAMIFPILERWGGQSQSLSCTEFTASLPTLTEADSFTNQAIML